jgi:peptide/nickel transport system substrate-binding protein
MRQVLCVSKTRRFPSFRQWKQLSNVLSKTEKQVVQTAFLLIVVSIASIVSLYLFINRVEIPTQGGEYTEALVGEPQLINPLYATSNDVDKDLVTLIYSGLIKWKPEEGLVPDLAESININEEGTVITATIRENARFHNGDPILARDILFTINAIQNPAYRSPLYGSFKGVSVVQEGDRVVSFVIEKPSAVFLQNLTVGILPSGLWADVLPQNAPLAALNLQPVGSGPFQFVEFTKDKKGSIRSYTLKPFKDWYQSPAFIDRLTFQFYPDQKSVLDALENKYVKGVSVVPFEDKEKTGQNRAVVLHSPLLDREVVLYFNQKTNEQLKRKTVREAIALAIDKTEIVNNIIQGQGRVINGPLLSSMLGYKEAETTQVIDLEKARTMLKEVMEVTEEAVKKPNKLTLTVPSGEEFSRVANYIKTQLEAIELEIEIITIPSQTFFDDVISPRNFELLLTTVMFDATQDPYLFWHSSQIGSAGLNIVEYQNADVDKLLESARATIKTEERQTAYQTFEEKVVADLPAIFLYQSNYNYAVSRDIQNVKLDSIRVPFDRFAKINEWYIKTKKTFR